MATYQLISSVTVGSGGAASIDFTSIPATYTDLCLVTSLRTDEAQYYRYHTVKINNSTANQTWRDIFAESTTPGSQNASATYFYAPAASATANTFSNNQWYFPNYAGSNNKSFSNENVSENNSGTTSQWILDFSASLWSQTTAINQITLVAYGTTKFVQYSTAYLYGIKSS